MLLSLRKKLIVVLRPSRIEISEISRGWKPHAGEAKVILLSSESNDTAWAAPIHALDSYLRENQLGASDIKLIVSDYFFQYVLLPWSDALNDHQEMETFARIQLESVFGEIAKAWDVQIDMNGYGKLGIACAIDSAFLRALQETCATNSVRLTSLQPMFMRNFNRLNEDIVADTLLVFVDDDQCILASYINGDWQSIRKLRCNSVGDFGLVGLIDREILLQNCASQITIVAVVPDGLDMSLLAQRKNTQVLFTSKNIVASKRNRYLSGLNNAPN